MKKASGLFFLFLTAGLALLFVSCKQRVKNQSTIEVKEGDKYDNPDKASEFQAMRTKSPITGYDVASKMWAAVEQTVENKEAISGLPDFTEALNWTERGSYSDAVGPSNGNPRPNSGVTSGRIDAILVDATDATGKTVWIGGDMGGLWKTTDITASPATWQLVNDFFGNLIIAGIAQDPVNPNTMYFCTGEGFYSVGISVGSERGIGVFKSTDHGVTWSLLPSTTSYIYGTRIVCDNAGNVYLGSAGSGLLRSSDGGNSWTNITPSGVSTGITDIEISSTGRMHIAARSNMAYRYTNNPATVTSASGWVSATTSFTSGSQRAELGVNGNTLYALPSVSNQVPAVWKSVDGGDNWSNMGVPPTIAGGFPFANGQGFYNLTVAINPANADECIIGGIDNAKTTNGGTTWTRISNWVGTTGQYVHADQHASVWYDNGNKLIFGCDGGVHFSSDKGVTIRDRNVGLRLKQFYSCAIHPTATDYFLAGAQDNGTHQLNGAGLTTSIEVFGGDGGFVAIDQDEPQFQTGTYVYANFRRSTNGGANWSSSGSSSTTGLFINPYDYDNLNNRVYAGGAGGQYIRWENPQTGFSFTNVSISAFNSAQVASARVSEFTANRVFFGTTGGRVVKVDNAEQASPTATNITGASMPSGGFVNCINLGSSEQNIVATYTNFDVTNIWVSGDGGTTWTGVDGNLPNMPVYWAMFHPDDNGKMIIATETGVWETSLLNGASTAWTANTGFPTVRTTMLKYRASDRTVLAATYGRGLWTAPIPSVSSGFTFNTPAAATATCPAPTTMSVTLSTNSIGGFSGPITLTATSGVPAGTFVTFGSNPLTPGSSTSVILNNTNTLTAGTYNITIQGTAAGATTQTVNVTYTINPGTGPSITTHPVSQTVCEGANVTFSVTATGTYQWQVSTNGGGTWSNISGATATSYTINGVAATLHANQYRCVVSNICAGTNSVAAILTVNTLPAIATHPQSVSVCTGSSNTFSVVATGTGLSYQWQYSTSGCSGPWANISGAITASYTLSGITAGMNNTGYRCVVSGTCTPPVTSNCALLTVATSVSITTQPASNTVCAGGNSSFTVAGSGTGIIYQWQINTGSGFTNLSDGGAFSGAMAQTLNISGATIGMNAYQYRCLLSTATCTTPSTSNAATLTVNILPAITSNPQNATLCSGGSNTFSVTASGTGIGYQWQVSTDGGISYTNISGATSSSYTAASVTVAMNNNRYRCVVSGTCPPAATSSAAILTVYAPVSVSAQPANVELCSGGNATFTVAGTSVPAIIYQWQVSTDGGTNWTNVSGANAASISLNGVIATMSNNRYRCLLSNATCTTPTVSNGAILTVRATPTVTLAASPFTTLLPGQTTVLTASPGASTGGTFSTTWTYNTAPLTVTGNTYTVNIERTGVYQVAVRETWLSGLFCSALSAPITIDAGVSSRLFIFPSPNDGNFTVSYYNNGGTATQRSLVIFDSRGSQVYNKVVTVTGLYTLLPVNLTGANTGIYYVVIGDANGTKLATGKVHIR